MRRVQIYVNNRRLDLFDDEKISVKSSIQDVSDISKVFTDFSQSFTVPASDRNNDIFKYYYNNDLNEFNANTRVEARIEINYTPFRKGKVQLEGSIVKENQVEAYKITFYGDVVTLKDLFGDDKLSDLNYTGLNITYSGAEVINAITDTSYRDVRYPLISSERVWSYGGGSGIDSASSAIDFTELFPAISDSKIMDLIESKYGVTFSGNFLTDDRFKNSYTWWKNRSTTNFTTEPIDITFDGTPTYENTYLTGYDIFTLNKVNLFYIDMNNYPYVPSDWYSWSNEKHKLKVNISNTSNSNTYYLDVYENGVLVNTQQGSNGSLFNITTVDNTVGLDREYTFKLRSDGAISFEARIVYELEVKYISEALIGGGAGLPQYFYHQAWEDSGVLVVTAVIDFSLTAPDMKIADWFSGTLKQFNLTCYPLEDTLTYQVEPLEDFYKGGNVIDITKHIDDKNILVDRAKLYNDISFQWEKSQSFMNEAFLEVNNRPYGDLRQVFPDNDGSKFEVKLPFETLQFNKFTGVDLQVAYALTKAPDYKPYIPKPVKLYITDSKTCSFYLNDGTTDQLISSYMPFGQDTEYNTETYSINFGEEISTLSLNPVVNSLYKTYYESYLVNLFNSKLRRVTVECVLPVDILTKISLDDTILIRDKKYRINDFTNELTEGKSKLVLLSDFTKTQGRFPSPDVPAGGGVISVPIKPIKGGSISIASTGGTPFSTPSPTLPTTLTSEGIIKFTVPVNSTGLQRTESYEVIAYRSDGSEAWRDYITITQTDSDDFLLTESGGYLLTESLDKIKL